jgi:hypothetical protein
MGTLLVRQAEGDGKPYPLPLRLPGLLPATVCAQLERYGASDRAAQESLKPLFYRRLVWELCCNGFLMRLQRLTGTDRLLPDPHLSQGGLVPAASLPLLLQGLTDAHPLTRLPRQLTLLITTAAGDGADAGEGLVIDVADPVPITDALPGARQLLVAHYYRAPGR